MSNETGGNGRAAAATEAGNGDADVVALNKRGVTAIGRGKEWLQDGDSMGPEQRRRSPLGAAAEVFSFAFSLRTLHDQQAAANGKCWSTHGLPIGSISI